MDGHYFLLSLNDKLVSPIACWDAGIAALYAFRGWRRVDKAEYDAAVARNKANGMGKLTEKQLKELIRDALQQRKEAA